jgi:HD-GYP domain-containing protein (c-di-GMP phosphodiesterase class II)
MLLTETNQLSRSQSEQLRKFGENVNRLGANFAVCDSGGRSILVCESGSYESDWESIYAKCIDYYKNTPTTAGVQSLIGDGAILSAILKRDKNIPELYSLVHLPGQVKTDGNAGKTVDSHLPLSQILSDNLSLLVESFQTQEKADKQAQLFTRELSQVYEELALIHRLSTGMKISGSDQHYIKMACESLLDIVSSEGIAVFLEEESSGSLVFAAGTGLVELGETEKKLLQERLAKELENGKEALLDSNAFSEFTYKWPENIRSIIAVPLYGKGQTESQMNVQSNGNHVVGLMVAVNRLDKPDYDSADIKLFNSVAASCAVFVENGRLFKDLRELFVGSLKALTSSIDAKDNYTRGHSERVALIAQWIAQRYAKFEKLSEERIHNIYLAGLLHDIGKIGIAEAVLCKNGKLTEEERNCINRHPSIGAGILSEIKQMQKIVPVVLCHHERIDGKGYPNGLAGDEIPLEARIIGLADSFDAMTSARVYRPAMNLDRVLDEIRKNIGTQFDEKVASVFLDSDIYGLWETLQSKTGVLLAEKEPSETVVAI